MSEIPHVLIALSKYGLKEGAGAIDNPEILQMAKDCGFKDYVHDEISWCSLFMNWIMKQANKPCSNSLAARSWLNIGEPVQTPVLGDLCVLWRDKPDGWQGHISLYISEDANSYYLLGGNQGDMVNITAFPKGRLLGFRRV